MEEQKPAHPSANEAQANISPDKPADNIAEQKQSPASARPVMSVVPPNYQPYIPRSRTPEYMDFKAKAISQKGLFITVLSLLIWTFFVETIFLGSDGISVPIFAVLFYSVLYYYFRENDKPLNKAAMFLTIPVFLLAFSFFLHYNPSTQFITWPTLIGLICIQLILLGKHEAAGIFTFDMLSKIFVHLFGRPFPNLGMPFHSFKILKNSKSKTTKNLILILVGLAVSLPVAAILMSLFMSADALFADSINNIIEFIGVDFANISADIILGCIFGLFFAAALLGLKYGEVKNKPAAVIGNYIDGLIIGTFMTIINICIIAFVGFQFVYLFGGAANIAISDMTYAEYARRGFFELTTASGIIFAIALFVQIMTKKKEGKLPGWVKFTTVLLCACNGILLVSAVKRMLLYVDVYGLSVKRLLTLWFMAIIGICLVWMIIKCFSLKMDVMKWIGITVVAGVCILSLTNTERLIAKYNIDRYISNPQNITLDVYHLSQLSYTTTPEIKRLKDLDLKSGPISNDDILYILKSQKNGMESRNNIYGFTLDTIEARNILDKLF